MRVGGGVIKMDGWGVTCVSCGFIRGGRQSAVLCVRCQKVNLGILRLCAMSVSKMFM